MSVRTYYFLLFIIAIVLPNHAFSQTGPAGVGNNQGTSDLILWVKNDEGLLRTTGVAAATNDSVSIWQDQSGSSNDLATITGFLSGSLVDNLGHAAVFFDNDVDRGLFNILSGGGYTDLTIISVFAGAVADGTCRPVGIGNRSNGSTLNNFQQGAANRIHKDNGNLLGSIAGAANTIVLRSSTMSTGAVRDWYNGDINIQDAGAFTTNNGIFSLGTRTTSVSDSWVYETMFFQRAIDTVERILIENYLAGKYGITMTSKDLYTQDDPGNGNYDHDIAGIGRLTASSIVNDSRGTGVVRILNPAGLGDNEFLIWGHDDGAFEATEFSDIPAAMEGRVERVWRVSEVDTTGTSVDVGNIDVRFDMSEFTTSITASDLRLLVDTDNDNVFTDETPISGATSLGSGIYQFAGVSTISDGLRFTIGSADTMTTPLPLSDYKLVALQAKSSVNLHFGIYSPSVFNKIEIQKSHNSVDWNSIHEFNERISGKYESIYSDSEVSAKDTYYRLKVYLENGDIEFSKIAMLSVKKELAEVKLYPNPSKERLYLWSSDLSSNTRISIYDLFGNTVLSNIKVNKNEGVNISGLQSGIYRYEVILNQQIHRGKFVKQ